MTTIRSAQLQDAAFIATVDAHAQDLHYRANPEKWRPPSFEASLAFFRKHLADSNRLIVVSLNNDNSPTGYAWASVIDVDESQHEIARRIVMLEHLGVAPEYEGQGYGRALLA